MFLLYLWIVIFIVLLMLFFVFPDTRTTKVSTIILYCALWPILLPIAIYQTGLKKRWWGQ